jgi:hypothetical protein
MCWVWQLTPRSSPLRRQRLGRLLFEARMGKIFARSYLNQKLDVVVYTFHPTKVGNVNRRIMVEAYPRINTRLY